MGIDRRLRGSGRFILHGGQQLSDVPIQLEQTGSGTTFLSCSRTPRLQFVSGFGQIASFEGTTEDSKTIRVPSGVAGCITSSSTLYFRIRGEVQIGDTSVRPAAHVFSITNTLFPDEKRRPKSVVIPIKWAGRDFRIRLSPHPGYQNRVEHLRKTRGVIPTAILRFSGQDVPTEEVEEFVSDLCHAISLTQGRKVNWIHHAAYDDDNCLCWAKFGPRITKRFNSVPLAFVPSTNRGVEIPIQAIEPTVCAVQGFRNRFDKDNRIINSWLDARSEDDYLEGRTLKFVTVIEALTAAIRRIDKRLPHAILADDMWEEAHKMTSAPLQRFLQERHVDRNTTDRLISLSKWKNLNSPDFSEILTSIFEKYNLKEDVTTIKTFSRIRNTIVHRFNYDGNIRLPDGWRFADDIASAQHFFVAAFVDRVLLELFGLGRYVPRWSAIDH